MVDSSEFRVSRDIKVSKNFLLYEDVDVTVGNMPGSVVTANAEVYEDRLPVTLDASAKTALAAKGFKFIATEPAVTRPY